MMKVKSWGRAAYAFFKIVNDQLTKSEYRLYAITAATSWEGCFLHSLSARRRGDHCRGKGTGLTCRRSIIRGMASITTNPGQRARQKGQQHMAGASSASSENRIGGPSVQSPED